MRVLLDENIPVDLATELVGHDVDTVADVGWIGIANGRLLRRASGQYDAFVTMDRSIQHQQNLAMLPFGILLLRAPSNRMLHIRPLVPAILDAITALLRGELRIVGP